MTVRAAVPYGIPDFLRDMQKGEWEKCRKAAWEASHLLDSDKLRNYEKIFGNATPQSDLEAGATLDVSLVEPLEAYVVDTELSSRINITTLKGIMDGIDNPHSERGLSVSSEALNLNRMEARFLERIHKRKFKEEEAKLAAHNPYRIGTDNYRKWQTRYESHKSVPTAQSCAAEASRVRAQAAKNTWAYLTRALEEDRTVRQSNPKAPLTHFAHIEENSKALAGRAAVVGVSTVAVSCFALWYWTNYVTGGS